MRSGCGRDGLVWHVIYVMLVVVMLLSSRQSRVKMCGCGGYGVGSSVRNRLGGLIYCMLVVAVMVRALLHACGRGCGGCSGVFSCAQS